MKTTKKNILVKGYYGFGNFGDDIFCQVINWRIINYTDYEAIFIGKEFPKDIKFIKANDNVYRNLLELYYAFKSKHIIFFGGSLFHTIITKYDFRNFLSKLHFNKKTTVFGVSVGPFKNKKAANDNLKFLNSLNYVYVRDTRSLSLSEKFKYSFDPALMINKIYEFEYEKSNKNIIGVNVGNFNTTENTIKQLQRFLNDIEVDHVKVFLLNNDDKNSTYELVNKIKEMKKSVEIIEYSNDLEYIFKQMKLCNFMVGERLHFGIVSFALKLPFILVEYHPKCTDFLKEINYPKDIDNWNLIYKHKNKFRDTLNKSYEIKYNILNQAFLEIERYLNE